MTGDERGTSRQHVEKRQLKQKIKNQKFPPEADKPFPPWAGLAEKVKLQKCKVKVKNKNAKIKPGNLYDRKKNVTESLL